MLFFVRTKISFDPGGTLVGIKEFTEKICITEHCRITRDLHSGMTYFHHPYFAQGRWFLVVRCKSYDKKCDYYPDSDCCEKILRLCLNGEIYLVM